MRVLTTGGTELLLAVTAGIMAVALPASAGVTVHTVAPAGELATRVLVHAGRVGSDSHLPAAAARGTTKVVLGTAVAYVREPDGTVRRYR